MVETVFFYSGNNEIYKPSVVIRNGSENRGCPNMTTGKVVNVTGIVNSVEVRAMSSYS